MHVDEVQLELFTLEIEIWEAWAREDFKYAIELQHEWYKKSILDLPVLDLIQRFNVELKRWRKAISNALPVNVDYHSTRLLILSDRIEALS